MKRMMKAIEEAKETLRKNKDELLDELEEEIEMIQDRTEEEETKCTKEKQYDLKKIVIDDGKSDFTSEYDKVATRRTVEETEKKDFFND